MRADLLFVGGTVRTGVAAEPVSDALAVTGGRIVALGDDAVRSRGTRTEVIDLAGGALLPSFGDGHAHPLLGGRGLRGAPVRDAGSVEQILEAVAGWAAAHPDAHWVVGEGFDPSLAPDGRFDARWLDTVVADRPVALLTMDYHTVWVNSEGLRRAGIDAATAEPVGGEIVRREDGTPLGTLREWGAIDPVLTLLPDHGRDAQVAALAEVAHMFASHGITWVQDALVEHQHLDPWFDAAAAGLLTFRTNLAFHARPGLVEGAVRRVRCGSGAGTGRGGGLAHRPYGEVLRRRRRGGGNRGDAGALR